MEGKTLLEKRRYAREHYDHIRKLFVSFVVIQRKSLRRKRLMLEPRGHGGMYGAILVHDTELTATGEADIGVLFCHNGNATCCSSVFWYLSRICRGLFNDVRARNDGPWEIFSRH